MTVNPEILDFAKRLYHARTVGEVYSIPLPKTGVALKRPGRFSSFFDYDSSTVIRGQISNGFVSFTEAGDLSQDQVITSNEPLDIATEFCAATVKIAGPTCAGWQGTLSTYMSGRKGHGNAIHFDHPEAKPNDMVGLTVSSDASLIVPHQDAGMILARSEYAHVLDIQLSDPKLGEKLQDFYNLLRQDPLKSQMREAMIQNPANEFRVNAGITVHTQPGYVQDRRICTKIVMHLTRS